MNRINRRGIGIVVACLLVCGLFVAVARAGTKYTYNVYVDTTYRQANGSIGDARNSTDSNQLLSCTAMSGYAYCFARTASGTQGTCYTTNAGLVSIAAAVKGDSYVSFYWNSAETCTDILVENGSHFAPKAP